MNQPINYTDTPIAFTDQVKSWINSCHTAEQLNHIAKFVNRSPYRANTKRELLTHIKQAETILKGEPLFIDGELCDKNKHPKVYTTRFSAHLKCWQLTMMNYSVQMQPTGHFYRIRIVETAPIEAYETV